MSTNERGFSFTSVFFLQLTLGVFFLMMGIRDIQMHSSLIAQAFSFIGNGAVIGVVVAVVEIVAGVILVLGLFLSASSGVTALLGIVLFGLWVFSIVMVSFVDGLRGLNASTWENWLYDLSRNLVILAGLWIVGAKYLVRGK